MSREPAANRRALRRYEESLDDDLNTAEALGIMFEYIRDTNSALDDGRFPRGESEEPSKVLESIRRLFDVLGHRRNHGTSATAGWSNYRGAHSSQEGEGFCKGGEIRAQLLQKGIVIEDTREGSDGNGNEIRFARCARG